MNDIPTAAAAPIPAPNERRPHPRERHQARHRMIRRASDRHLPREIVSSLPTVRSLLSISAIKGESRR